MAGDDARGSMQSYATEARCCKLDAPASCFLALCVWNLYIAEGLYSVHAVICLHVCELLQNLAACLFFP